MHFSLLIVEAPATHQASLTAYRFATAALAAGHALDRVFFFRDAVLNAASHAQGPAGEPELPRLWDELARTQGIDMVACVSSALRRGIVDDASAGRRGLAGGTVAPGIEISGLGQLVDACIRSDRVITFGG